MNNLLFLFPDLLSHLYCQLLVHLGFPFSHWCTSLLLDNLLDWFLLVLWHLGINCLMKHRFCNFMSQAFFTVQILSWGSMAKWLNRLRKWPLSDLVFLHHPANHIVLAIKQLLLVPQLRKVGVGHSALFVEQLFSLRVECLRAIWNNQGVSVEFKLFWCFRSRSLFELCLIFKSLFRALADSLLSQLGSS